MSTVEKDRWHGFLGVALAAVGLTLIIGAGQLAWGADDGAREDVRGTPRCATTMPGMPGKELVRPDVPLWGRPEGSPLAPPPNPGIGDSWLWYIWHLAGPPSAELRSCTVRGMGEHCYVVVEDTQWGVTMNQADVDAIVARFDSMSVGLWPSEGIWDLNTSTFGMPPDALDQDPRIYLVYYDFDISADGFWWVFDEYPDGTQPYASNECEAVYLNCSDRDPGSDYMISIVGHEFEHMIHWAQDEDEASWVDEGVAEYAMFLFGEPDVVTGFAALPDNDLTAWGGTMADYAQTYLFMLYLHERFGGRPMLTTVVAEPANSMTGITNALITGGYAETFLSVFQDWGVANFLDDSTIGDGRYGYVNETLPRFSARRFATYPVGSTAGSVNHWAADYVTFVNGAPALNVSFDGADTGLFAVYLLQMGVGPTLVDKKTLDALQRGTWSLPGFSSWMDSVVVVAENVVSSGAITYTFSAAIDPTGDVAGLTPVSEERALGLIPNPMRAASRIAYVLAGSGPVALDVYGPDGRLVRSLVSGVQEAGNHETMWNGRDAHERSVPSGVYWVRLDAPGGTVTEKLVLMR